MPKTNLKYHTHCSELFQFHINESCFFQLLDSMGVDGVIMFRRYDRDGDGVLSMEEFEPLAHRLLELNVSTFAHKFNQPMQIVILILSNILYSWILNCPDSIIHIFLTPCFRTHTTMIKQSTSSQRY